MDHYDVASLPSLIKADVEVCVQNTSALYENVWPASVVFLVGLKAAFQVQ
jgi:hypothetical protein